MKTNLFYRLVLLVFLLLESTESKSSKSHVDNAFARVRGSDVTTLQGASHERKMTPKKNKKKDSEAKKEKKPKSSKKSKEKEEERLTKDRIDSTIPLNPPKITVEAEIEAPPKIILTNTPAPSPEPTLRPTTSTEGGSSFAIAFVKEGNLAEIKEDAMVVSGDFEVAGGGLDFAFPRIEASDMSGSAIHRRPLFIFGSSVALGALHLFAF